MAAGDLENILMTAPDSTMHSSRARNIIWRDNNNVNRSVKYVYWCPDGVTAKLVWQRDHSTVVDEYSDSFNSSQKILLKYRASTSTITSLKLWSNSDHNHYNEVIKILNASTGDTIYNIYQNIGFSYDTDTLTVNGTSKTVYTIYKDNLNIQVSEGTDYYIYFGITYPAAGYWVPLVYSNATGDYAEFTGEDYYFQGSTNILSMLTSYSDHKIKAEVNGVQV
jgi:hypothetical protein